MILPAGNFKRLRERLAQRIAEAQTQRHAKLVFTLPNNLLTRMLSTDWRKARELTAIDAFRCKPCGACPACV